VRHDTDIPVAINGGLTGHWFGLFNSNRLNSFRSSKKPTRRTAEHAAIASASLICTNP